MKHFLSRLLFYCSSRSKLPQGDIRESLLYWQEALDITKLATVDLLGEHYGANYTARKVPSIRFFYGPTIYKDAHDFASPVVTFVNVKEKLRNGMRCHKTPSKFAKSLTSGALILWGRSRLQEGTSTYSWLLTTCQNGLKQRRSPPMMPELFANF
ncbi:hypothetical protein Tco_1210567 [Tanacetum coccineum]